MRTESWRVGGCPENCGISQMKRCELSVGLQEQVELAVKCCKQNHIYQLLYPDPANLGQQMICQNQKQAIGVGRWMIPPQVTSVFIRFSSS